LKTELLTPAGRPALELKVLWRSSAECAQRGARALWRRGKNNKKTTLQSCGCEIGENDVLIWNIWWNYSFCNLGDILRILHWREPTTFISSEAHRVQSWVSVL